MWSQLLRKQGGCIRYCTVRIVSQALYELCSWTIGAKSSPKMNCSGDKHQQRHTGTSSHFKSVQTS